VVGRLPREFGPDVPDDGVHRVVRAATVEDEVVDPLRLAPLRELQIGAGVFAEVPVGVGVLAVPGVLLVARMNEEDVTLPDVGDVLDHVAGVDTVVTYLIGDVGHDGVADEFVQRHRRDVAPAGDEVFLAVEVGPGVVHELDLLPVDLLGIQALLVPHLRVVVGGPGRRVPRPRLGQVVHLIVV